MTILDQEFNFSTLNATDVDRMLAATEKQKQRAAAEGGRYTPEGSSYPDWLRFQCRLFMDYLDEVLGEGASARLGLDGSNFNDCMKVSQAFAEAMAAEKQGVVDFVRPDPTPAQPTAALISAPMNRAQRRAAAKAHPAKLAAYPAVSDFQKREADKADRRKQLLAELAELDND